MTADAQHINTELLQLLSQAGGFGPWQRCQLFVGAEAAAGARSILHFDQYDNLFLQVFGRQPHVTHVASVTYARYVT